MSFVDVTTAIETYGYWIILATLFCGIVGIPAPEETFMVLVGMLVAQQHLMIEWTILSAFVGTIIGMISAYVVGRWLGRPFIDKYGRFIKISPERWRQVSDKFHRYGTITVLFGLFIPGLRQLAPYIAGTSRYPFGAYSLLATLGSLLWSSAYIIIGFFIGDRIPLRYLPWLGVIALVLFIGSLLLKKWRLKGEGEV